MGGGIEIAAFYQVQKNRVTNAETKLKAVLHTQGTSKI